ncbi:IS605 OrfB family transposase, partial [Borrelia yangtzensis]|nr:IS605 OrfB family transposase [Borreliella yangtzensis]
MHGKILNQRKDFLHKLSYYFVVNYKNIVIENLSIKGM